MNGPSDIRRPRFRDRFVVHHGREISRLSAPIVLTMFSQTLMWTVDTIFLGHHSSLALGAAGLGGILLWTSYSLFNNLSRITGTFVSQAHGRGDDEAVGGYAWHGLYIATTVGLMLTILAWNARPLLNWTGIPSEILDATAVYMGLRGLSAVFSQWGFSLMGYFQGRRKVAIPMWAGVISNVVNGLLDWWLIFGWEGFEILGTRVMAVESMGLRGAALATSAGVVVNALILLGFMFGSKEARRRYRIHVPRALRLGHVRRIVVVGAPSSVENFVDMSTFAMFSAFVGRGGETALAANQIQIQLLSFSFMPLWGLTSAGSVLMGNWMGAGEPATGARYGRQVYKLGLYYSLGLALTYMLLREHLFRVFTPDPAVLALGATLAVLAAIFQIGDGLRMIGSGLLTGAGDTRPVMILTLAVMWGVFLPAAWWTMVHRGAGVATGWTVASVCYLVQGFVLWLWFRRGRWQRVRIFGDSA